VRIEVRVTGKRWSSKAEVDRVKFGEKLTAEAARRAMRELGDKGGFAKLAVEAERAGSGVVLRIVAVPSRTVSAVQIEGGTLDRARPLRAPGLVTGGDIRKPSWQDPRARSANTTESTGSRASIVVQPVELDDPLSVLLVITIDPRRRAWSRSVFVIGRYDKHVGASNRLRREVGRSPRRRCARRVDRGLAQALREAHFYKARIAHKVKHVGQLSLHLRGSGPRWCRIFEGNERFDRSQLTAALALDEGQSSSIDELRGKLEKHYQSHGFLDAEVAASLRSAPTKGSNFSCSTSASTSEWRSPV
jgi:hypothetical protein